MVRLEVHGSGVSGQERERVAESGQMRVSPSPPFPLLQSKSSAFFALEVHGSAVSGQEGVGSREWAAARQSQPSISVTTIDE